MLKHRKNTITLYEYSIAAGDKIAFTLWFTQRRPSLNRIYRLVSAGLDAIRKNTGVHDIQWNGDGTITAGEYRGKMTGRTLFEARGYTA